MRARNDPILFLLNSLVTLSYLPNCRPLNPFQSPIPPQYNNPPNYFVEDYTRKEDDGWCCKCQAADLEDAPECLTRCKFAIIKSMIDPEVLDMVREGFQKWKTMSNHHMIGLGYRIFGEVLNYGRREYVLPANQLWVTDEVLLNKVALETIKSLHDRQGLPRKPIALEYATVIDTFTGLFNQWFHSDTHFEEAVNLLYPLVDVTPQMGPFHLNLNKTKGVNGEDIINCPMVFGTTRKGSGIMYKSYAHHRGSVCRGKDRPALFYTYMYKENAEEDMYLDEFGYIARRDQQIHSDKVSKMSFEHESLAGFVTSHNVSVQGSLVKNMPGEVTMEEFRMIIAQFVAILVVFVYFVYFLKKRRKRRVKID